MNVDTPTNDDDDDDAPDTKPDDTPEENNWNDWIYQFKYSYDYI